MPSVFVTSFAIAGAVAAAGPIVIHLLNRRRFRRLEWAAMDFLRQAMQRSRKILQLRDILLLLLRTACVLLFGLAMARPYLQLSGDQINPDQPIHAVLAIDNSLSMSYQRLDGNLLDEAKQRAREFIEQLPTGSRYSIVPMCAFAGEFAGEPYRTREDAIEAIEAITVVDRAVNMNRVFDMVKAASQRGVELPTKRVVVIGDQQQVNWPLSAYEAIGNTLPDVQVVRVAAERPDNAWIADFRVQDALADIETTTTFIATIGYDGPEPRTNVQVTLTVDGVAVASRTVDLEPGQRREVSFPHRFDLAVDPGRAVYALASVSIPPDRLNADDIRWLAVPVVAALPVVFVDELGDTESPANQQYGETYRWRRLLSPITSRSQDSRQLITVRHLRIDELDREVLKDVRLVVIAGVESPTDATEVLAEFVEQGGQLVVAAGGKFDPNAWNQTAWRNGAGWLPLPVKNEFSGVTPDEAVAALKPFFLEPASLVHDYFQIEDLSNEDRADLFRLPLFFKSAVINADEKQADLAVQAEQARLAKQIEQRQAEKNRDKKATEANPLTPSPSPTRGEGSIDPKATAPAWLLWAEQPSIAEDAKADELAERTRPRVIAKFTNQLPYLVERDYGRGHVMFVASGVQPAWNNLMSTNAALLFDRIFRTRIERTLPERNFGTIEQLALPVDARDRQLRFTLERPLRVDEPLWVDALGGDAYAVSLRNLGARGIYRVRAQRAGVDTTGDDKLWEVTYAINGPGDESQLRSLTPTMFAERAPSDSVRWVDRDETISLAGSAVRGQDWWRLLMAGVLVLLIVELGVLSWTSRATGRVQGAVA